MQKLTVRAMTIIIGQDTTKGTKMDIQELAKNPAWWQSARDRVKAVMDGPDTDVDRIIRGILENGMMISAELLADFPALQDRQIAAAVRNAVSSKNIAPQSTRGSAWRH